VHEQNRGIPDPFPPKGVFVDVWGQCDCALRDRASRIYLFILPDCVLRDLFYLFIPDCALCDFIFYFPALIARCAEFIYWMKWPERLIARNLFIE